MVAEYVHRPVMVAEILAALNLRPGGRWVDGTLGSGSLAASILSASSPTGWLCGCDRDGAAIEAATQRLAAFAGRFEIRRGNFAELGAWIEPASCDGVVLDLGVSSPQLDRPERGFSFQHDAPLDMRMDDRSGVTAADLVNTLPEAELARIIREFGEERWARRIARFIVDARTEAPVSTTLRLVDLIKGAIPRGAWEERIHPATRTFQALRIAVNDELVSLARGIDAGIGLLKPGGRGVAITFHSLEDRIVKHSFRERAQGCICPKALPLCICGHLPEVSILTSRAVRPGEVEMAANPRARSARLRAVEKLGTDDTGRHR